MLMPVSVDFSPWETIRDKSIELSREYVFTGIASEGRQTIVELRHRFSIQEPPGCLPNAAGCQRKFWMPFVYLVVEPYVLEQRTSGAALFGPSDDLINYKVLNTNIETSARGVNFFIFDICDGQHLSDVLMLGQQITVRAMLASGETVAYFPLENDTTFQDAYNTVRDELEAVGYACARDQHFDIV
jgi:hypothetical protein